MVPPQTSLCSWVHFPRLASLREALFILFFLSPYLSVSSYDRDSTFNVFVGKGQLIAGMDQALVGMCVNERRFVKIPPKLAYGSEGVCKFSFALVNTSAETTRTFAGCLVRPTGESWGAVDWGG